MRCSLLILFALVCGVVSAQQAAPAFSERDARYRLQANDVIEIQYRYTPEYNQTVSIQPDGFVTLQLLGDVKVGGLTLDKAHDAENHREAGRVKRIKPAEQDALDERVDPAEHGLQSEIRGVDGLAGQLRRPAGEAHAPFLKTIRPVGD